MINKKWNPAAMLGVQALLIYIWLTDLSAVAGTDTYYSVYLLLGLALTGNINVGVALFHGFQIGL